MSEAKFKISIVNKAEVMADLDEIKAELNEVEATIERIGKKASQLIDTVKCIRSADEKGGEKECQKQNT